MQDQTDISKLKILIVDDEVELSELYKQRLVDEGFQAERCSDGETALARAREYRPDLILLDLMMPRLSGFDAIDLFRHTVETSAAKIIILSALSQPADMERAESLGADDYIVKSDVSIDTIVARVRAALGVPARRTGAEE